MICKASGGNIALSKGPVIPGTELWKNISYILFQTEFLKSMWFTLRYTIVQTLLTLLICGLAGFAVEIYHDKYKDILFKVVLFAMMISITPLMVPLFAYGPQSKLFGGVQENSDVSNKILQLLAK